MILEIISILQTYFLYSYFYIFIFFILILFLIFMCFSMLGYDVLNAVIHNFIR